MTLGRPPRLPLPRYVRRKWLRGQQLWGHFFEPPTWAKKQACPIGAEALGTDYANACRRAETVLLKQFDSWRTAGRSDLVPNRMTPGIFDWLVATYKAGAKYTGLSRSQRTNHDLGLRIVADHILKDGRRVGSVALRSISADVADRLYEKLVTVDGRERRTTINHAMKSCRRAWNVVRRAEPRLVPAENPFSRMGLKDASKATPTAEHGELLAFVAAADEAGRRSLGTAAMIAWEWLQREEHIFSAFLAEHYRPKDRPNEVLIVHPKTSEEVWIPLFDGPAALFPELTARLDEVKRSRIGGVMVVRDWTDEATGRPVPWITNAGDLTYMRHRTKAIIKSAGIRPELTFTSFRHGGMTEMGDADLTDAQIRAISRHKDARTLPRYVKKTQRQIVDGTRKRRATRTKTDGLSE